MKIINNYPDIKICDYQNLKNGRNFKLENGNILINSDLTLNPTKPLSYAFCSDTEYLPEITKIIQKVDCLYHETTFLNDKENLATTTKHSTAQQAAEIAKLAMVKRLIIGHFSSRYKNKDTFLTEAKKVFKKVVLAEEGKTFNIT